MQDVQRVLRHASPATKDDMRTSMLLTIKDLIYAMFQLAIERYEEKHGKVELRKQVSGNRDQF